MNICIFGLGYVGAVSAGCLAKEGHTVIGVDPYQPKVDLINKGQTPVIEADIGEIISNAVNNGTLRATTDVQDAVTNSDMSFICVGTPSLLNGGLDLKYVRKVCEEIGESLASKSEFHVVVARSTMLPGTMSDVVIPTLQEFSGKTAGVDFGVCNNPEFLREGTAVYDFYHPPKTVIGETDEKSGDLLSSIYEKLDAPLIKTDVHTAEMVKYSDNVWHALKVGFANEIGNISKAVGVDGHAVMDIFCQDTKLNLSPYYMKPGFAFGGSCLPKDVRALVYKAHSLDVKVPILDSIMESNKLQVERGINMISSKESKKVGILGFSFKAGTDDLRESPVVEVIERLLGRGYELKIFDKNVNIAKLVGANRDYIMNQIPHISKLMVEKMEDVVSFADTIVIGNSDPDFKNVMKGLSQNHSVVDLVRIVEETDKSTKYDGICW